MKKFLRQQLLVAIFAAACLYASAQEKAIVNGIVSDDRGQLLPNATVTLLQFSDSSLAATAITDEKGLYEIAGILPGKYLLSCSMVGFQTAFSSVLVLNPSQRFYAGQIRLTPASRELQEVTVSRSRAVLQVKPDKTIFNVASSVSSTGSNGIELLQKMPGIQVDEKGKISLKGKMGVRIYVDGRMVQLTGDDLAAYLRSINSNDIEAIEIITAPGAKYDASGNAGVINFKFRKNTSVGTNGSVTAGFIQGITPKGNGAANVNYRNLQLNVFANASFNSGQNEMDILCPREQKGNLYDQHLIIITDTRNYNAKAGMDWFINPRKTIGIIATGNISQDDWFSNSYTDIYEGSPTGAELTGWFNGPGLFGPVFRTRSMGALDVGVQKQVLREKGNIRLGITDIIRTGAIWRARNDYNGLLLNIYAVSETRTFRVTFSYNVGNRSVSTSRQRETGMETEKNRIKEK